MKIAYIAAGAGGMYCGSCIHDNTLAAALQQKGHEVALLPTYTPLRTDEESVSDPHLFYGAVNVYLQHKSRFFRRTPRLFDRLLDRPAVLRWIARLGASTDPRKLGQLTLDVLRGESGPQSKELERLVAWLADSYRPDIVQITNSLLLGMVRRLRAELGVPVVVALQGEDLFVDQLREPHRGRVLAELRERANDPDLFIAPSRYYADHMANILGQERSRIDLVPLGIQLDGHGASPTDSRKRDGVTIGYLARICPEKGLHRLVDAFIALAGESGASALRLRVAGYLGARDRGYWAEQQRRIADAGLADRVDFLGEIDRVDKIRFLNTLDLLSVPTVYR
ncbi:MAG: glycosyltransferase family 4 protein, partial [Acidobacteria bacterium]|nr:glycosyltransferase family 4 protein [Acidobacteriota bacterium]